MSFDGLTRPGALEEPQWSVVVAHVQRMHRARGHHDWAQAVGTAKELCESVAKLVLDARGESFSSNVKFDALLSAAHRTLDRQPGEGLALDPPVRTWHGPD